MSTDTSAKEALEKMFDQALAGSDNEEDRAAIGALASGTDGIDLPDSLMNDSEEAVDETNLQKYISELGIPGKIKLAVFGNKNARALLIRDSNRQVALFVLQNNRLRESEVVDYAKNTNLDEQIHRAIARNPSWTKSYGIKLALVSNPKAPTDVAMKHSATATMCRRMVEKRAKKGG